MACLLLSTSEPSFLLYGELRDPRTYLAILRAIGSGHHTLSEVANAALVGKSHLIYFCFIAPHCQDLPDAGEGWQVTFAVFARAGFTGTARSLAQAHGAWLVDLDRLDRELGGVGA